MAKSAAAQYEQEGGIARIKSFPERSKTFLRDVRTETKKVTSPSMKEVRATTLVVIITVFVFAVYFFLVDTVLGFGIERMLRYFTRT
jgi:preprotein translocase subunit SecE